MSHEPGEDFSGTTVQGCFIGVSRNGLSAVPNDIGIRVQHSETVISYNVISGNLRSGVIVYRGAGNQITSNLIGVNITGAALPNGGSGVRVGGGGSTVESIYIGSHQEAPEGNLIAGNAGPGIHVMGDVESAYIHGNRIGGIASGVGNAGAGLLIEGHEAELDLEISVPSGLDIRGNEIVFNEGGGVRIDGASGVGFFGNRIGVADDSNPDAVVKGFNGEEPAFLLIGNAKGDTEGVLIGDDTVESYNIIATDGVPAVVIVTGDYDDSGGWDGDSAINNQVYLNRYRVAGSDRIIDHVGWNSTQLAGEGDSEAEYRGGTGPCSDEWEGVDDSYGNRRTLSPILNPIAIGESDGDFYLYASGIACLAESLTFFVTSKDNSLTEPVIAEGEPLLVFDGGDALASSEEDEAFFTLDGYGPVANVVEGDFISVISQSDASGGMNSSEFSHASVVVICTEDGVDADADGFPGNACSGFSDPGSADCDDEDADVYPGATEWCDNDTDDDCDGAIDDDDPDDCVDPPGDDDDGDDDDGDDDDSADEGGGYRPPGCVISCDLADGASSHSLSALALMLAFATLRRRRELSLKVKAS